MAGFVVVVILMFDVVGEFFGEFGKEFGAVVESPVERITRFVSLGGADMEEPSKGMATVVKIVKIISG